MRIENNPNLLNIEGLSGLAVTLEEIWIQGKGKLQSLDGLEGLSELHWRIPNRARTRKLQSVWIARKVELGLKRLY